MPHLRAYDKCCFDLQEKKLYRALSSSPKNTIKADFSHNDYLSLSNHPLLIQRAQEYASTYGVGGRSSRILQQDQDIYLKLEEKIARSKKTEAALIFNSGYQANATVLAALLDARVLCAEPLVFADRLNHASLHHGITQAGAKQNRYQHLDMNHLETLLDTHKEDSRPKFIVTESVFGMDGDVADLTALVYLAAKHGAFLYVDEAHATGLYGEGGYGLTSAHGEAIHLGMGTFSKAVGVSGGYVACSARVKDYLVNRCGGFIYTTAPSPTVVGAVDAAWDMLPSLDFQRQHIQDSSAEFRRGLFSILGEGVTASTTHIVPLILKDIELCSKVHQALLDEGILVSFIRPPTVPANSARLRVGIGVEHTRDQMRKIIEVVRCHR